MRCEEARQLVSASLDGEAPPDEAALRTHVDGCPRCTSFERGAATLRRELRVTPVRWVPDVAAQVRSQLEAEAAAPGGHRRHRAPARRTGRVAAAVVALVVGIVAGALVVGGPDDGDLPRAVAATVPERVLAAQHQVESLRARVEIREHGWHPDVSLRTFDGSLTYRAPESLALDLRDTTAYPDARWPRNDVRLVVDGATRWVEALRDCPSPTQPACTPAAPRAEWTQGRDPFSGAAPLPLDLVVPAGGFEGAAAPDLLGERTIGGREAVGVEVPAAQVDGLLAGLRPAGNLREVHPTDRVALWLDAGALVPLELTVSASGAPGRDRWARNRGYDDRAGATVLEVRFRDVEVGGALDGDPFATPPAVAGATLVTRTIGFVDGEPEVPPGLTVPSAPAGLRPHRAGTLGDVTVWSWSDGRAWLALRATTSWDGDRPFGTSGAPTREVELPGGGVAHVDPTSGAVAVHGVGLDLVVEGSVGADVLRSVAAASGVEGLPLPAEWIDVVPTTAPEASRALGSTLRLPPAPPPGFGDPVLSLDERAGRPVVHAEWVGAGARAFSLTAYADDRLGPPRDPDVAGLALRGTAGRVTPDLGEVEWVEDGVVYRLSGPTLSLAELVAIAETMEPVR